MSLTLTVVQYERSIVRRHHHHHHHLLVSTTSTVPANKHNTHRTTRKNIILSVCVCARAQFVIFGSNYGWFSVKEPLSVVYNLTGFFCYPHDQDTNSNRRMIIDHLNNELIHFLSFFFYSRISKVDTRRFALDN
jgi:hypothetical protein